MNYNDLQLKAINSPEEKIVVIAIPGSGKTTSLVGAISKYVKDNPNDNVVAITFTKKAASELFFKLGSFNNVETATIHSWSLKELNKLGSKYGFKVSLLTDIQIQEILQHICRQLGYYSINYFLLTTFVMGNYNIDISDGVKARFQKIQANYIQYKRNNCLYDFTDLPLYLLDVLEEYGEEIANIDGLFVDEFQDVDPIQAEIFRKVKAKKFFYIGDPQQSIYTFRGADAHVLDSLTDFTILHLEENYRSYQAIIDFSANIQNECYDRLGEITSLTDNEIKCVRTDQQGEVYSIDADGEGYDIVLDKRVRPDSLIRMFVANKAQILCRGNKQVKEIQSLGYKNVSTIHQAKGLEYPMVIVTDMALSNDEERNVAYVACTRAQNSLLICDFTKLIELLGDCLDGNSFDEILF